MQDYFIKNALSEKADQIGAHAGIFAASTLFFLLLWGFRLPAFTAGLALYLFIITLRRTGRDKRLKQKENNLRRRIGGELAIERMLTQDPVRAHFEAALLISDAQHLEMCEILPEGIMCRQGQNKVLIAYLQQHAADALTPSQVAAFQRACKHRFAVRGILCTPGSISAKTQEQADTDPPVMLLQRDALIRLFGAASPATDSQLVKLSQRQKKKIGAGKWWKRLTEARLSARYARYAALMITLFFLTQLTGYAYSAIGMMTLCALCRCKKSAPGRKRP